MLLWSGMNNIYHLVDAIGIQRAAVPANFGHYCEPNGVDDEMRRKLGMGRSPTFFQNL